MSGGVFDQCGQVGRVVPEFFRQAADCKGLVKMALYPFYDILHGSRQKILSKVLCLQILTDDLQNRRFGSACPQLQVL